MGVDISGGGVCDIPAIDLHGHQSAVVSNGLLPRSSLVPHVKVAGRHGFGARAGKEYGRQLGECIPLPELAAVEAPEAASSSINAARLAVAGWLLNPSERC
ncbi:hypothetical protein V8C42DRAFT_115904 [Trichoderma barbatum]